MSKKMEPDFSQGTAIQKIPFKCTKSLFVCLFLPVSVLKQ